MSYHQDELCSEHVDPTPGINILHPLDHVQRCMHEANAGMRLQPVQSEALQLNGARRSVREVLHKSLVHEDFRKTIQWRVDTNGSHLLFWPAADVATLISLSQVSGCRLLRQSHNGHGGFCVILCVLLVSREVMYFTHSAKHTACVMFH